MLERSQFIGIPNAIPDRICNYILEDVKKQKTMLALIGTKTPQEIAALPKKDKENYYKRLNSKRNSNVSFLDLPYIFKYIFPFIKKINKDCWNLDFDQAETCQYTEYGTKQFYNWHQDSGGSEETVSERKLSCSLLLNNPNEYDGGDLQFSWLDPDSNDNEPKTVVDSGNAYNLRTKGTLIVFPSYLIHRVTPITRGIRKSLVIWWRGKPFS
jgi:PKHD-type hydroxylase